MFELCIEISKYSSKYIWWGKFLKYAKPYVIAHVFALSIFSAKMWLSNIIVKGSHLHLLNWSKRKIYHNGKVLGDKFWWTYLSPSKQLHASCFSLTNFRFSSLQILRYISKDGIYKGVSIILSKWNLIHIQED